ncbi:unnamed protein product, partial [Ixodes hexagonus]
QADLDLTFDDGESPDSHAPARRTPRPHREASTSDDEDIVEASGDGSDEGSTSPNGVEFGVGSGGDTPVTVPGQGTKR